MVFSIFLIFTGAALLSTLALYTRQSLLVAYLILGIVIGPWGFKLIADPSTVSQIGDVGIIFLLFLLGLNLHPQKLFQMLKKTTWVALISSTTFSIVGALVALLSGFALTESIVVGLAMMFSSTIIGLKLLPTTVLHHQHTGEIMISILLMQDLLAMLVLLGIKAMSNGYISWLDIGIIVVSLPALFIFAFVVERYVLIRLLRRFDRVQEYMFLLAIAWCLSLTELAKYMGLSEEIGALVAGVSIATSPIALYIAESLKPLRDFFLVIFFFSIGASFNWYYLNEIILPALGLAILLVILKPFLLKILLIGSGEQNKTSFEVGARLGQASEFSLLVAYLAQSNQLIAEKTSYLIQATTILTFIISTYFVVQRFQTPVATCERLRRD